jgi:protein-tyrosine phosphatase
MIDIHCHILPGVDDGAQDLEAAIAMGRMAEQDGTTTIICTPHFDPEKPLSPAEVTERVRELGAAFREAEIGVELMPGAEIALHPELAQMAKEGLLPTLGGLGKHLLIELPFFGEANYAGQVFFQLQLAGFAPIISHPERSIMAAWKPDLIEGMKSRGVLLQVNASSLRGGEGRRVRNVGLRLVRQGLATLVASDSHETRRRVPALTSCRRAVDRLGIPGLFEELTTRNPGRLLGIPG